MNLVQMTVEQIIVMLILMIVGVLCYKTHILDTSKSKVLSDILIKVITPALIIDSFQRKFEMELLHGFLITQRSTVTQPWACFRSDTADDTGKYINRCPY